VNYSQNEKISAVRLAERREFYLAWLVVLSQVKLPKWAKPAGPLPGVQVWKGKKAGKLWEKLKKPVREKTEEILTEQGQGLLQVHNFSSLKPYKFLILFVGKLNVPTHGFIG